jgi:hypothetical protein
MDVRVMIRTTMLTRFFGLLMLVGLWPGAEARSEGEMKDEG